MSSEHADIIMIWVTISGLLLIANFIGAIALFTWFNNLSRNKRKLNTNRKTLPL